MNLFRRLSLLGECSKLKELSRKGRTQVPTPSMEDHIEQIYQLIEQKGYARVSDIAEALEVLPSSVTKMVQKLDKDGYLHYEKYRGLTLTPKGNKLGKKLVKRHDLLENFLRLAGVSEELIYQDVEGIEHHLSWESIDRIAELVLFFEEHPELQIQLEQFRSDSKLED